MPKGPLSIPAGVPERSQAYSGDARNTEGPPPRIRDAGPSGTSVRSLHGADAYRLRPAVTLLDVEFNPLTLFKAAVAIRKDG